MSTDDYDPKAIQALAGLPARRRPNAVLTQVDGEEWLLQRDPGETDLDYKTRQALFILNKVPDVPSDPGDELPDSLVVRNPDVMGGRPVFRGTRVPVEVLFENLADGLTLDEILDSYPTLDRADCEAVIKRRHHENLAQIYADLMDTDD